MLNFNLFTAPPDLIKKEIIEPFHLDMDPVIIGLWQSIALYPENMDRRRQLYARIAPVLQLAANEENHFRPMPIPGEVDGPIRLAISALGHESGGFFGLYPEELMRGCVIMGYRGTGKTNILYLIIDRANRCGIPCIVFEIKEDCKHLIRRLPSTIVLDCRGDNALKFNPIVPPPGVSLVNRIVTVAEITAQSHSYFDGTANYFIDHANKCCKEFGSFDENTEIKNYPDLRYIYNSIKSKRELSLSRDARYRESALNRLESILFTGGDMFNCNTGHQLEKIIERHNVVFRLTSLGEKGRIYLISLILSYLFQFRIANPDKRHLPVLVIIDEGNEVFNKWLEERIGSLMISSLARQAREFNLGIVVTCQEIGALCDSAKNVYTQILMRLPEGRNLRYASESMGLTREQLEFNYQLQTGQAIIRLGGRYDKPFPVKFPLYRIEKNVTDGEIIQHMRKFAPELIYRPVFTLPASVEVVKEGVDIKTKKVDRKTIERDEIAMPDEKAFLMDIYNRPFISITQRYKEKTLSAGRGNSIVNLLVRKGFCRKIEISLGGRGGLAKYLEISDSGYKAIEMPKKVSLGRGAGFEHCFWQWDIFELLNSINKEYKKGWRIEIERNIKEKFVDIAIERQDGNIVAIEVAVSAVNEKTNLEKDIKAGCSLVVIACKSKDVFDKVKEIIENTDIIMKEKVKLELVQDILRNNLLEKLIESGGGNNV